mmetsp:Transcript_46223/g.86590  ORF Transcript_46223/g.86590 Transcript_46223/m.86590 type:complete len:93 (-) Transcript_46223:66-344(-)
MEVRFASGKLSRLKINNLETVDIRPGDLVSVSGLESKSGEELNNWKGTVTRFIEEKSRFEVCLPPRRLVSLKPENLTKVDNSQFEDYPGRYD